MIGYIINCLHVFNVQCFHLLLVFLLQKLEGRMASDFDLKLSDLLRYYANDTNAALDLLYRRSRALANYEHSNKVSCLLIVCNTLLYCMPGSLCWRLLYIYLVNVGSLLLRYFKENIKIHFRKLQISFLTDDYQFWSCLACIFSHL